jgi:hypothetical protein
MRESTSVYNSSKECDEKTKEGGGLKRIAAGIV